jgi:isoamylase
VGAELAVRRAWTKGSSAGFISDVDARGNRFNPNKLLSIRTRAS